MASLEIYNSTATEWNGFMTKLADFILADNFMTLGDGVGNGDMKDINNNSIPIDVDASYHKGMTFYFSNFCDAFNMIIVAGRKFLNSTYKHSIVCLPIISSGSYGIAFYSDENKPHTIVNMTESLASNANITSSIYSNFRALRYLTDNTKFLSLGLPNESITLSTHVFKSIDDPTNTKTVFIITDKDGYVSFYDSYTPYPWHVENIYHNGNNIGHTSSINAYKLAIKGYYCDNLYYFDGAYSMPGEGVSTIGGIKFLKLGDSNLFIKME